MTLFLLFISTISINMLSSQHSSRQDIIEAAQPTDEISIIARIHRWFYPDKYAKSLLGDDCDKEALLKLKLERSIWIKKILVFSSIISEVLTGVGLAIGAICTNEPGRQYFLTLCAASIFSDLWIKGLIELTIFILTPKPLEIAGSL